MLANRKNVLVVVHETSRTGAPILGWNIASRLSKRYNVFTVRCGDGPLTAEFEAISVSVCVQLREEGIRKELSSLLNLHSFEYAIINSTESRHLINICKQKRIPTLFLVHEFSSYVRPLQALNQAFNEATEIIFPAPVVAESALKSVPNLEKRKINILPQGKSVIPSEQTVRNSPPSLLKKIEDQKNNCNDFVVLGAGSVNIRKGVDLFIATAAAVKRISRTRMPYFIWVGHGYRPDKDMGYSVYLNEQVTRSGLKDCVHIIDEVSDLDPFYALADVFLLSSRTRSAAKCGY